MIKVGILNNSFKPCFAFDTSLKGKFIRFGEAHLLLSLAKQDDTVYLHTPIYAIISQ